MKRQALTFFAFVVATAITPASPADPPSFMGIGFLPNRLSSRAAALSADGQVIMGPGYDAAGETSFRWTRNNGMSALPQNFTALDLSADGAVVVGKGYSAENPADGMQIARWTEAGGLELLGWLGGDNWAFGWAVSADGSTIVGTSGHCVGTPCYPWTGDPDGFWIGANGVLHRLNGFDTSHALGVSANGSAIVGVGWQSGTSEAARWNDQHPTLLGHFPDTNYSSAMAISGDGEVVLGGPNGWWGEWRWTAASGWAPLASPGDQRRIAFLNLSHDGSVAVGMRGFVPQNEAVIWDAANGIRPVAEVLVDCFGLDLSGWTLTEAVDVSADGLTITGNGLNPQGQEEAWIAHLGHGPCPPPCPGDVNADRAVDLADLATLLAHFGLSSGVSYADGDLDADDDVDLSDLANLLANFGSTCL